MTLKLYFAPGACSFVPHTMLEASGAAFEPVLVKIHKGENHQPEFLALNHNGQVPVLVDGDHVITQIMAIVTHLDARFPQCGFLPTSPLARAGMLQTLAWMNNTVHPTFTHAFMPHKFTDNEQAQAEVKKFSAARYGALLGELEAMAARVGEGFFGGAQFGPVDAYALTLTRWGGLAGHDPKSYPALWALLQRLAQVPAVARAIERERLQLDLYKPA